MNGKIIVVGIGPGNPEWLTLIGKQLIENADIVAGFKSVIEVIDPLIKGKKLSLDYKNQEESLAKLAEYAAEGSNCVVVCQGDPYFSGKEFLDHIKTNCHKIEVISGISSLQVVCTKANISMEDSLFITLHRRDGYKEAFEELTHTVKLQQRHIILLPRPWDLMPNKIAQLLLKEGIDSTTRVLLYEHLTLKDEKSYNFTLGQLSEAKQKFSDLSIMVILNEKYPRKAKNQ